MDKEQWLEKLRTRNTYELLPMPREGWPEDQPPAQSAPGEGIMEIQLREEYPRPGAALSLSEEMITTILLTIERIRPEEIIYPHQPARIGPYTFAEVRIAIAQKAITCRHLRPHKMIEGGLKVQLFTWNGYGTTKVADGKMPKTVQLRVTNGGTYILDMEFPILEPKSKYDEISIAFNDWRTYQKASLYRINKEGATLEKIQYMWSGLRWLCRNLRTWEQPGFFYPEEVN